VKGCSCSKLVEWAGANFAGNAATIWRKLCDRVGKLGPETLEGVEAEPRRRSASTVLRCMDGELKP
jgi:hypothetical protein